MNANALAPAPHTPVPAPADEVSKRTDTFEDRRDAIDQIATLRARTIRVALIGTLIHRPNPAEEDATDTVKERLDVLREQIKAMRAVRAVLQGKPIQDQFAPSLYDWIYEHAKMVPGHTAIIFKMIEMSEDLLQAAENNADDFGDVLNSHFSFGRGGFWEAVTEFCNQLWASLDSKRAEDSHKANQASQAVGEILTRLTYIGKHVRLVSLNASVEAARAGEAGRGLAVIATEFKSLAEEIQTLALSARTQIDTL